MLGKLFSCKWSNIAGYFTPSISSDYLIEVKVPFFTAVIDTVRYIPCVAEEVNISFRVDVKNDYHLPVVAMLLSIICITSGLSQMVDADIVAIIVRIISGLIIALIKLIPLRDDIIGKVFCGYGQRIIDSKLYRGSAVLKIHFKAIDYVAFTFISIHVDNSMTGFKTIKTVGKENLATIGTIPHCMGSISSTIKCRMPTFCDNA